MCAHVCGVNERYVMQRESETVRKYDNGKTDGECNKIAETDRRRVGERPALVYNHVQRYLHGEQEIMRNEIK